MRAVLRRGLVPALALAMQACTPAPPSKLPETPAAAAKPAPPHPLDPLSQAELANAVRLLREAGKLSSGTRFALLALNEPPKDEVLAWKAGAPFRREAFAIALDRAKNQAFEAVVDLAGGKVVSTTEIVGAQPPILVEEFTRGQEIVRADARWQEAMKKRGITRFEDVQLDVWAPGHVGLGGALSLPPGGPRLLRVLSHLRGTAINPYSRPIEGVIAVVDAGTERVIELIDTGVVPIPGPEGDFFDPKRVGKLRPAPKRLVTSQPDGSGIEVTGNLVRWQGWEMRVSMHPREGLVLHQVAIRDGDRMRPVAYRLSLSEMVVPYGDPAATWAFRNAFDEGEYGLGRLANTLSVGREVPSNALVRDAVFADDAGEAYVQPGVLSLYEKDAGVLWTHTDFDAQRTETRRARELHVGFLTTIGNYDYAIHWIFSQDASIRVEVALTGAVLAKGVSAEVCAACSRPGGPGSKPADDAPDRFGAVVAPGVVAPNHQHFFNFRLDLDVDGADNSVVEQTWRSLPAGPDNPFGNAFAIDEALLATELDARRDHDAARSRMWEVLNPATRTALGHYPGYVLEPGATPLPLVSETSLLRERAPFIRHPVWVTRRRDSERHAAGPYPNQSRGGGGVWAWTADGEAIARTDVVLWYTFGVTHMPRPEEFPVMSVTTAGFRLVPKGFFTRNPSLDLPP
ncbi:MAG: primary-amine oxidase [Polyangiaceae bacterium]